MYHGPPIFYFFFTPAYGLIQDAHRNLFDHSRLTNSSCQMSRDPNLAPGQANPHLPLDESIRLVFILLWCYLTTLVAF